MKKLVSLFLVLIVLTAVAVIPAYAAYNLVEGEYLYEEKFVEEYIAPISQFEGDTYIYEENYYHHVDENNPDSDIDWIGVTAMSNIQQPWLAKHVIGDRVFWKNCGCLPFEYGKAVFDVKNDRFVELTDEMIDDYVGLREYLEDNNIGSPIGDADLDDKLTVLDATYIQRAQALLCEYYDDDDISNYHKLGNEDLNYISDFDRDGERTVLDATGIQLKLAGLEEKPVVNEELVLCVSEKSFNVNGNAPQMPENASVVPFETKANYQEFSDISFKVTANGNLEHFQAIIKSNEQFDQIFNEKAQRFDDEFFESKWLVVSLSRCYCHEAVAPISALGVEGDTLYLRSNSYVPSQYDAVSPTTPHYMSIVAVDKALLSSVTNIVKVK